MTTTETATQFKTPSATWLGSWVGYHLRRMEAVECEADIELLMRFGATEVRRTFEGVSHALIWEHLQKQRAHREAVQITTPRKRQITGRAALRALPQGREF